MRFCYDRSHSTVYCLFLASKPKHQLTISMQATSELGDQRVSDVALEHPNAIRVFNKYNIDYCCGGKNTLREACEKAGLSTDPIVQEIRLTEQTSMPGTIRFHTWDASLLANFIIQHHHSYVKQSIPELKSLLEKVCTVHGKNHPVLFSVKETFDELANELTQHMEKEEVILFPEVENLFEAGLRPIINLNAPMAVMEDEHETAGNLVKSIRQLTNNYTPPAGACPTFNVTYKRLQEFEQDLMQHIHLENNVLFDKVRKKMKTIL